jgi:hypothetical protein
MLCLDQMMDRVDAKAIDIALEPKSQHREHCSAHIPVAPVEIRLLLQEGVVVVLLCCLIERPGRPAELARPVVWR